MATERVGIHSFAELEASIGNAKTAADVKTAYESNANTNEFSDSEQSKLAGVEAGAEVNPTDAQIKTAYENNANTNAFTDAEKSKLTGIASGAEVNPTASAIKTSYESNANTNAFTDAEQTKLSGITAGAEVNAVDSVFGRTGSVTAQSGDYTKSDVGLANVDNTSDANKPISTATQTALDAKQGDITLTTTGSSGAATLVGDTLNIPQYSGGGGGIAAVVDDTTPQLGGDLDLNTYDITGTGDINITGTVTSNDFIGDLNGAVRFGARNQSGATLLKGKVVSITGVSGNETLVDLADADDATARPAFGLVYADANNNAGCEVVTLGNLIDVNTSAFLEGDTLFVSTSAGELTATAPTGEAAEIQNIGKVIRSHATAGIIRVGGAGRANATPNLDSAKMFLGNASNQSASVAMSGDVTIDNTGTTTVGTINSVAVATVTSGAALGSTANQDSTATILSGDLTGTVNSVAVATVTSGAALGATATQPNDNVSTLTNDAYYVPSNTTGVTGADIITNMISLTQLEYDAITTPDASTLYIIT